MHQRHQCIYIYIYKEQPTSLPRNRNISALPCDINQAIIIITQATAINPDMPRLRFDLNPINIMPSPTFKLQIANNHMLALLELQSLPRQPNPLPTPIDRLIRRNPKIRRQMNRPRNLKDDP